MNRTASAERAAMPMPSAASPAARPANASVGSAAQRAWGNGLTSTEFDLSDWDSHYCRVTVRDQWGGKAWSNPIWLEE